jgi:hypothetical protein
MARQAAKPAKHLKGTRLDCRLASTKTVPKKVRCVEKYDVSVANISPRTEPAAPASAATRQNVAGEPAHFSSKTTAQAIAPVIHGKKNRHLAVRAVHPDMDVVSRKQ